MAWTTPKQFVDGEVLTARDLNTYLRDNLLECEVMRATTSGSRLTTNTTGDVVERIIKSDVVNTEESHISIGLVQTSPTTWTSTRGPVNLGTPGPSVTVTTGTRALVFYSATMTTSLESDYGDWASEIGVGIDCPTSSVNRVVDFNHRQPQNQANELSLLKSTTSHLGMMCFFSGLTPGPNTFIMRYFVETPQAVFTGGALTSWADIDSNFSHRQLMVLPI